MTGFLPKQHSINPKLINFEEPDLQFLLHCFTFASTKTTCLFFLYVYSTEEIKIKG